MSWCGQYWGWAMIQDDCFSTFSGIITRRCDYVMLIILQTSVVQMNSNQTNAAKVLFHINRVLSNVMLNSRTQFIALNISLITLFATTRSFAVTKIKN